MARTSSKKDAALKHLKRVDPAFHAATKPHHASLPSQLSRAKTRAQLFESLVEIVISQQLGVAASDTIFARLKTACKGSLTPDSVLKLRDASYRKAGISGAKTKTIKSIARAVKNGELDLLRLKSIPEPLAAEQLLKIWGLGPWSAEMFLMFGVGREDIFSAGDLGLVRAIEMLYRLPKDAPRSSLLTIAERWSPYRTYASLLLWRFRDANKGKV